MTEFPKLLAAYLGIMALLALTVASSFVELGALNPAINLVIAAAKTCIILVFFMHLWGHGVLPRLTALAVCMWLGILFVLTLIDR